MALIEGIKIRNFRSLRDVTLGKTWQDRKRKPLTPLTVVVGKNGVGKSSLFDAFGFLADCLTFGILELMRHVIKMSEVALTGSDLQAQTTT